MVDSIRKQLNELMGENRNDDVDPSTTSFTAPQYCRYYLCGSFSVLFPYPIRSKCLFMLTDIDINVFHSGLCPYDVLQKTVREDLCLGFIEGSVFKLVLMF